MPMYSTSRVAAACFALVGLCLTARAETVTTSFEPGDGPTGMSFVVSGTTPGVAAEFSGGESKTVGQFGLYRTGMYAWMMAPEETGVIEFENPASAVNLWALGESGVTGTLEAFDADNNLLADFAVTTSFQEVDWQGDALGAPIDRITATNAADSTGYLVVDDFSFEAIPEPAGYGLAMIAAVLLVPLARRPRRTYDML